MISDSQKLGVSIAASWAWGTSLIVGMEIAQNKGIGAWAIWALANTLTLAVFCELARRNVLGRHVFDKRYIKFMAVLIQCFCLVIQLNIINKVLIQMGMSSILSYCMATLTGIVFTIWMYKKGLSTSIKTDFWQWIIAVIAILSIIAIGIYSNVPNTVYPTSRIDDLLWGIWSAVILLSGPIGDVQHWQRADVAGKSCAFLWGSVFFGVYMLLILAMSYFKFNMAMNVILLLAVLCVTSSTIDSIAVAMHEISNKKTGTFIAIFICVFWGVFAEIGIIQLWSNAGKTVKEIGKQLGMKPEEVFRLSDFTRDDFLKIMMNGVAEYSKAYELKRI